MAKYNKTKEIKMAETQQNNFPTRPYGAVRKKLYALIAVLVVAGAVLYLVQRPMAPTSEPLSGDSEGVIKNLSSWPEKVDKRLLFASEADIQQMFLVENETVRAQEYTVKYNASGSLGNLLDSFLNFFSANSWHEQRIGRNENSASFSYWKDLDNVKVNLLRRDGSEVQVELVYIDYPEASEFQETDSVFEYPVNLVVDREEFGPERDFWLIPGGLLEDYMVDIKENRVLYMLKSTDVLKSFTTNLSLELAFKELQTELSEQGISFEVLSSEEEMVLTMQNGTEDLVVSIVDSLEGSLVTIEGSLISSKN